MRFAVPAALTLVAVLAAGCSDKESPNAEPSDSPSASASPTEAPSPTATPASGKALTTDTFSAHAPQGWSTRRGGTALAVQVFAFSPDELTFVAIADGAAIDDAGVDERAQEVASSDEFDRPPKVTDPVTIDGVEAYRVAGDVGNGSYIIEVGAIANGQDVNVRLETFTMSPEEAQETLDSVLASWQWS